MPQSRRFVLVSALVCMLILDGCRTYGDYNTESKTYEAMYKAVDSFENKLYRAKADLRMLKAAHSYVSKLSRQQAIERAATQAEALQPLLAQFQAHVDEHSSLLETQLDRMRRLSPDASYQTLSRAYGATVTEQRMMRKKYQRVIRTIWVAVPPKRQLPLVTVDRKYTIRPINFPTVGSDTTLTMGQALQGL